MKENVTSLEHVILQESYVSGFRREGADILISMELLLDDGRAVQGHLVFPQVGLDKWEDVKGKDVALEDLNYSAHRYFGGANEPADMGAINSISQEHGWWLVQGDWGGCRLRSDSVPRIVISLPTLPAFPPTPKTS